MAKPDGVFVYVGTYPSEVSARADYDIVKDLHAAEAGRHVRRFGGHQGLRTARSTSTRTRRRPATGPGAGQRSARSSASSSRPPSSSAQPSGRRSAA